jgi:hypothetical protein
MGEATGLAVVNVAIIAELGTCSVPLAWCFTAPEHRIANWSRQYLHSSGVSLQGSVFNVVNELNSLVVNGPIPPVVMGVKRNQGPTASAIWSVA